MSIVFLVAPAFRESQEARLVFTCKVFNIMNQP